MRNLVLNLLCDLNFNLLMTMLNIIKSIIFMRNLILNVE